jgi:hypothetical protein
MTSTTVDQYSKLTHREVAARVLDRIKDYPAAFSMWRWVRIGGPDREVKPYKKIAPDCGTTMCAAGWTAHETGWYLTVSECASRRSRTESTDDLRSIMSVAVKALGLPDRVYVNELWTTDEETAIEAFAALAALPDDAHEVDRGQAVVDVLRDRNTSVTRAEWFTEYDVWARRVRADAQKEGS